MYIFTNSAQLGQVGTGQGKKMTKKPLGGGDGGGEGGGKKKKGQEKNK